jgi:hypothetical protein
MRPRLFLAAAIFVLGQTLPAGADQPPSAEQYYAHAIQTMRDLPQPNFATYIVQLQVTGSDFILTRQPNGKAEIRLTLSSRRGKSDLVFPAAYRKNDDLTAVKTPEGSWGTIRSPLFNPTWNGVADWIRYGLNGRPDSATATPSPTPAPNNLPVIGAVRAMGVAFYDVSDAGTATCANGDSAHRVHLIARNNPLDHPLTDAVIDERTNRLCFVRFEMRQSVVAVGYTNTIELNIADVNGESLVRNGTIQFTLRAMGFGVRRVTMTFAYNKVEFPASLTADMFPATR